MAAETTVKAWEEQVVLPTYPIHPADLNPMFLDKRVYQGSSGKVYPNPFTDRVSDERVEKRYNAVHLENEYIRLMILPEIGGRIHIGLDKTNQLRLLLPPECHQAGAGRSPRALDLGRRRIQLAAAPPSVYLHAGRALY